ncbi:MAG TPA: ABC transporter substrate-binding protein [Xanthobacteraceae bacterium]|nr:ABC transporter substrate-binding protein [Xanthobacteraceae bacterium]
MITRREFSRLTASAALGFVAAPYVARAAEAQTLRLGNASGIIDAQVTFLTVGQNPKTPFYKNENCAVEIVNLSGVSQSIQALLAGHVDSTAVSPTAFLNLAAKNPDIDMMFPYIWLRQVHWSVIVKPDSPLKEIKDLKGKRVGIRNQGDTGYIAARAMLKEIGVNPDKEVEWVPVGEGGPAGQSIYQGRVDAMAYWDGGISRIENATGLAFRHLPNTPRCRRLFGNGYAVRKSTFEAKKELFTRFFRAMAIGTVFAHTNVKLGIELHWEVYPESKPKGKTDDEAMKEALHVLNNRKDKWFPGDWDPDKRLGAQNKDQWDAQIEFAELEGKIKDVTRYFDTSIVDDVNKFDRGKIEKMARELKT